MPVSVVSTKSVNNVNAALRESLGRVAIVSNRANNNSILVTKVTIGSNKKLNSANDGSTTDDIDDDTLSCKLTTNARRALINDLEFEENKIGALDKHKTKYIIFKKITPVNNKNNILDHNGRTLPANSNNSKQNKKSLNGNTMELELPKPRHVLYSRNKIMVGWRQNSRRWTVGTGFTNVGNTCYLNSTLQALLHVPAMANWLSMEVSDGHLYNCKDSDGGCMICAMIKTMIESQTSTVNAIRPHHIYTRLKTICKTMMIGRQEDAHEFLRHLLESMERSYLMRFRETHPNLDQRSKETTPLNQIFGGYLRSAVRCLNCGHVSVTFQHFQEILLDIGNAESIEHAIDTFFSQEQIEGMCYKCEACKRKVHATKQFSMERAPPVLCIQLKRFNMHGVKLGKTISLKTHLDITKFSTNKSSDQLNYKLVAMITHLGHSPNCGHYTAVGLTASGSYYSFDDTYGRAITENSLINTNAYVIFYEMDVETARKQLVDDEMETARANLRTFIASKLNNENQKKNLVKQNTSAHVVGKFIGPELPKGGLPTNNKKQENENHHTKSLSLVNGKNEREADSSTKEITTTNDATKTLKEFYNSFQANSDDDHDDNNTNDEKTLKSTTTVIVKKQKSLVPYDDNNSMNSESDLEQLTPPPTPIKSSVSSGSIATSLKRRLSFTDDDATNHDDNHQNDNKDEGQPPMAKITNLSNTNNNNNNNKYSKIQGYEQLNNGLNLAAKKSNNNNNNINKTTANNTTIITIATTTTTTILSKANNCEEMKTDSMNTIFSNAHLNNNNTSTTTKLNGLNNNNNKIFPTHKYNLPTTTSTASIMKSTFNKNLNESPKSPRVINTTTGPWHVTKVALTSPTTTPPQPPPPPTITNNDDNKFFKLAKETTSDLNGTDSNGRATPTTTTNSQTFSIKKNHKNPFSRDINSSTNNNNNNNTINRRINKTASKTSSTTTINGGDNAVVNKLLKQSHRGYGVPVQSWNGTQSQIDIELENEKKEQRQREWEEDEENEMDRGRQKKVGQHKSSSRYNNLTPGFNPFQEQDNMRRWRNPRFFGSNQSNRTHFRNRFKYQNTSSYKFQRLHSANSANQLLRDTRPLITPINKNNMTVNRQKNTLNNDSSNNNSNNSAIEHNGTQTS